MERVPVLWPALHARQADKRDRSSSAPPNRQRVDEQIDNDIITFSRAMLDSFLVEPDDFRISGPPRCSHGAPGVRARSSRVTFWSSRVRQRSARSARTVRQNRLFGGLVKSPKSSRQQDANFTWRLEFLAQVQ